MIVPGRERLADQADIVEYRDMLTIVREYATGRDRKAKSLSAVLISL